MLVVTRFRSEDEVAFRAEAEAVADLLRSRPGCLEVVLGRNIDEPDLWTLTSRWRDVGSYRRGIGSYEVKLHGVPFLSRALDEPSAYEVVEPGADLNVAGTRGLG